MPINKPEKKPEKRKKKAALEAKAQNDAKTKRPRPKKENSKEMKGEKAGESRAKKRTCRKKLKLDQENENWFCHLCSENLKEDMIRCVTCKQWVHSSCAGTPNTDIYVCDLCV